jgi:hypothetical protein
VSTPETDIACGGKYELYEYNNIYTEKAGGIGDIDKN